MSKKQSISATTHYFRRLADQMGLQDWTIIISDQPSDEGNGASVQVLFRRKRIAIRLGLNWKHDDPETRRYYAVHELVHAHFAGVDESIYCLENVLGTTAYAIAYANFCEQVEQAVDALASALAHHLPLPKKGE